MSTQPNLRHLLQKKLLLEEIRAEINELRKHFDAEFNSLEKKYMQAKTKAEKKLVLKQAEAAYADLEVALKELTSQVDE